MTRTAEVSQYTDKTPVMTEDIEIVHQFIKEFEREIADKAVENRLTNADVVKFCVRFGSWDTFKGAVEGLINEYQVEKDAREDAEIDVANAESKIRDIKNGVENQITYLEELDDTNEDNWYQIDNEIVKVIKELDKLVR